MSHERQSLWEHGSVEEIRAVLDEIAKNQRAFNEAGRSWKRHIPFWLPRRQYRFCKANEPLWDKLDVAYEPFTFETATGINWSITRKLIGA